MNAQNSDAHSSDSHRSDSHRSDSHRSDSPGAVPESGAADVVTLLGALLDGRRPFALLRRETAPDVVDLLLGDVVSVPLLADLPVPATSGLGLLALVPYRQLTERGEECHDDGAPLLALRVAEHHVLPLVAVLDALSAVPTAGDGSYAGEFDVDDESYAALVKRVITEEINTGEGANFVLRRTFVARPGNPRAAELGSLPPAVAAFARLLRGERGAYWTFLVHLGPRREAATGFTTMVGATPERHVSMVDGVAVMNPISGTFRTPPAEASLDEVLAFLADTKEREELAMVLDEELKMLAAVSDGAPPSGGGVEWGHLGGQVLGPYLKEMTRLAHTEYLIKANTQLDARDVLRATMFAPTVTGSPLRNAFRVIARHEPTGRGYYGGVLALIGRDERGAQVLDAPILIRAAYLNDAGEVRVPVGATLVRGSDPAGEVRETWAKSAGVLRSFGVGDPAPAAGQGPAATSDEAVAPRFATHPAVLASLAARNETLASFWLAAQEATSQRTLGLVNRRVLVVDAEDAFTAMLTVLLRALGLLVEVVPYTELAHAPAGVDVGAGHDLLLLGPGPGDPNDDALPKMAALRRFARARLDAGEPLLGICLGHQILSRELGLEVVRREVPFQGTQREVALFGGRHRVGFYNSFVALAPAGGHGPERGELRLAYDRDSLQVHALRGPRCAGLQFHPESVLSEQGIDLVRAEIVRLLVST
jgi:phenazine biosynthesis protein phzE